MYKKQSSKIVGNITPILIILTSIQTTIVFI